MEDNNQDEEMKKIVDEEIRKMNIYEAEQRAQSIERFGRDIYTNKTVGNKKMKDINGKIDKIINIFHFLVPFIVTVLLIGGLIMAWGGMM
jgi:3-methyladenine DNA glycosylase AlkD